MNVSPPSQPLVDRDEYMTVAAARSLHDHSVCFVGIGMPSTAANLAKRLHAPNLVLIYESGVIGAKPTVLPLSIGDEELAVTADSIVSVPEIFNYWLQAHRVDVGFLGAAQLDRYANINTTVIGDYDHPRVRLPGAGGAPEIATGCGEVLIIARQSRRTFVEHLDFVTSVGQRRGDADRAALGLAGRGPVRVVTDLGILEPDPDTGELVLTRVHPGVEVSEILEATGWTLRVSPDLAVTEEPTAEERDTLRALKIAGSTRPHD
jgi:glutaconate CoA-transferase, subunit B